LGCDEKDRLESENRVFGVRQGWAQARDEGLTGRLREGVHAGPERKKDLERTGDGDISYSGKLLQDLYSF